MAKINRIVIPVYPDFDILDVCGPFAMFSSVAREAGMVPVLATDQPGGVKCLQGVALHADLPLPPLSATDAIWVPGGFGPGFNNQFSPDSPVIKWLRAEGPNAGYICSVCTGALLVAAAGLLEGFTATTHWQFQQCLGMFPGVRLAPGFPRYWIDRNRITGGGISSGLDASLAAIAVFSNSTCAMHAQLLNQYAPNPPFHAGSPLTAPPDILGSFYQIFGGATAALEHVITDFLQGAGKR